MPNPTSAAKVIAAVRNTPGNRVKVAVSDIDGVLRGKYLHKEKFYAAAEGGFGFCDVVFGWDMMDVTYDNTTLTGWQRIDSFFLSSFFFAKMISARRRSTRWGSGARAGTSKCP